MVLLMIALVLGAICVLLSWFLYRFCFYSPVKGQNSLQNLPVEEQYAPIREQMRQEIKAAAALPWEEITITAFDGVRLLGRYLESTPGAPLAIFFHGYRSNAFRDGFGIIRIARDRGMNILAIDQRAHCGSGSHTITFGVKERQDCLSWVRYAEKRFGKNTEIVILGVSMGAATVLMASELDLPKNLKAVVADCPYANVKDIMVKTGRDMGLPGQLYPLIRLGAFLFGGFDPSKGDAEQAVKSAKVPILIIHGEDDRFVPPDMSAQVARANPAIRRVTIPNAAHAASYLEDREKYTEIVNDFLDEVL